MSNLVYNITVDCSSQSSKLLKINSITACFGLSYTIFSMKMCGFVGFLILQRGTEAKLVEERCKYKFVYYYFNMPTFYFKC